MITRKRANLFKVAKHLYYNMNKWLEILLISGVLAILVNIISSILFEFFGTNLKKKTRKFKRRIFKFIKNENYPITISLKTFGMKKYNLTQKTFFVRLEEILKERKFLFPTKKGP